LIFGFSEVMVWRMGKRRKIILIVGGVIWLPIIAILIYGFIYQELKYRYLTWRVESAKTASEENAAFALAAKAGRIFEVDEARPDDLPEMARRGEGRIVRVEWLQSSAWSGKPFCAYRRVIAETNMQSLYVQYDN
jgi:hypothetical protein